MAVTSKHPPDLWSLALDSVEIDPHELLAAVESQILEELPDFRTRVLIRDSLKAIQRRWGDQMLRSRLSPAASVRFDQLMDEDLGDRGFESLESRMMDPTRKETIEQFLRELSLSVREPCRMDIGGSCALILTGLLQRRTDDIDAVNEVPAAIRTQYDLMDKLIVRYGLRLAHFQSHYLPDGWESRRQSFGDFGDLNVGLVDALDVLLGKLFSRREKDLDDLRLMIPKVGKVDFLQRYQIAANSLLSDAKFRQNAERNWYILFGEELPACGKEI